MANRTGTTATSTEVIPAGHAALTEEEERGEYRPNTSAGLAGLSVAALGVVFGDIGTSPVYTFRECFNPEHGLPLDPEHVLGVLSLIFWALIIVVAVKKLVGESPEGPEWLHESKFDGYRMHTRLVRGAVRLLTRTGLDRTRKYPHD